MSLVRKSVASFVIPLLGGLAVGVLVAARLFSSSATAEDPSPETVGIAVEGDLSQAFRQMSNLVGFELTIPGYLPEGNRITGLSTVPRTGNARGAPYVQFFVVGDNGGFLVNALREPLATVEGYEPVLVQQVKGAEVWRAAQPDGTVYYVTKGERAFIVSLRASSKLTEQEMIKILEGL